MAKSAKTNSKSLADNRRARFDYSIVDEFSAGIVLAGHEVKSARNGNMDLKGSYVTMKDDEAWLTNSFIARYKHATNLDDYDELRPRKLLLNRRELKTLLSARDGKLTIIPLNLYKSHGLLKLRIATARGKKKYDKRQTIKKRDINRDVDRSLNKMSKGK